MTLSRRRFLAAAAASAAPLLLPACLRASARPAPLPAPRAGDPATLARWVRTLRAEGLHRADVPLGTAAVRAAELAIGTPYEPYTLEAYLREGGDPAREPLTLHLDRFDCVSLVESAIAVARTAARPVDVDDGDALWAAFAREVERMRYRGGERTGYDSRLHYFSEWIADGERRGLLRDLGEELGGVEDARPLRFMTEHRDAYPALADDDAFREIGARERTLDAAPRRVVPAARIPEVADRIRTGDVLAFATSIAGLDVTHAAFAHRGADGVLRVLHAPLSGGQVEITSTTVFEYVSAIRKSTGILVARPIRG